MTTRKNIEINTVFSNTSKLNDSELIAIIDISNFRFSTFKHFIII